MPGKFGVKSFAVLPVMIFCIVTIDQPGMLNPLQPIASTSPIRFAGRLGQGQQTQESQPVISEQVSLQPAQEFRDPKQAIAFVEQFDQQLGLGEAMKKEKRELMAESSHSLFRGMPALFYRDLQTTFLERSRLLPEPAPRVTIVGDAHVLNAGTFRGPAGVAVWGLNDFDQTEIGSPEWDLERMGVSLYVAARSDGLTADEGLALVRDMGKSYLASLGEEGPAFLSREETTGKVKDLVDKAGSKDQKKFLTKWTTGDGTALLRGEDLEDPEPQRGAQILDQIKTTFPELNVLDLASKPHSGGSTRGLERYYTLIENPDGDPWILEVKAVLPTPVQIPDGDLSRGDGAKILEYQKQMGSPVDARHRAFKLDGVAFFTREREREKDSLKDKAKNLSDLAPLLGKVLARAHNSSGADIQGWVNGRDEDLLKNLEGFSQTYARQVESDYREFVVKYPPPGGSAPPEGKKKKKADQAFDGFLLR
jgi:uncharacterized protein (DUF2252 family)